MRFELNRYVVALWPFILGGCIIGTWPTPEERAEKNDRPPITETLATEACDGKDNDADGMVDVGCGCSDMARGCITVADDMCGPGIQWCAAGVWQECTDVSEPQTAPRSPGVTIANVMPGSLVRGGTEVMTVEIAAVTTCLGVTVDHVNMTLSATTPVMRVREVALDDGVFPDQVAGDGIFSAVIGNPFGPGVPAQMLTLRATALIDRVERSGTVGIRLEEP